MAEFVTTPLNGEHWYLPDGTPYYTIVGANGQERPVTLRDARKVKALPSVTNVIAAAARPGLENWKQEQMLMAALTLPKRYDESERAWLARVVVDSRETAQQAALTGTAIHSAIEQAWAGWAPPTEATGPYAEHVIAATRAVMEWDGALAICQPERSFAHPLGYGGKVDLSNELCVVDFKTKDYASGDDLTIWPDHRMQLAAYRHGTGFLKARCAICYVSRTVPGLATVVELSEDDLAQGWEMFEALLRFWRAARKYYP